MRKSNLEIRDKARIEHIMRSALICRLGLCKDNMPYIVPVNFGYDGARIYFHTAAEGMKIDYFAANKRVCFEVECDVEIVPNADDACRWETDYESVIGFGAIEEIIEPELKVDALNKIMEHYSERPWKFDVQMVAKARLWAVRIEELTGKEHKS